MKACCVKMRTVKHARRGANVAAWMLPGGLLVLMPKCPMCIAAYVAAGTGLGLSIPAASNLRLLLILTCVASPLFLATRLLRRAVFLKSGGKQVIP